MVCTVQWAYTVYVTVKVKGVSSERWREGKGERERVGRGGRKEDEREGEEGEWKVR